METTMRVLNYIGYIGIVEKKMETTTVGFIIGALNPKP